MVKGLTAKVFGALGRRLRLRPAVVVHSAPPAGPHRVRSRRHAAVAVGVFALLFVAIQTAASFASALTLAVADPVFADKQRRLARLEHTAPGTPRVILLGSSRTGFGFAAGRAQSAASEAGTPAVAFNHGIPGAGPITQLIHLRRYLTAGHRPDLLLLEVLPPLLADLPDGPLEARMLKGDLLTRDEIELLACYRFPVERLRAQWREAALSPLHEHRFKLLGRVFPSALPHQLRYDWGRTPDPNGWNASDKAEASDEDRARGAARAAEEYREVLKHDLTTGPAVAALRDTLALCRAEAIPVALVILPEATSFRALYPPGTNTKLARLLAELCAGYGCRLIDAREWVPDGEFLDSHHLLRSGAARFTDRLTEAFILPFLRDRSRGRDAP